MASITRTPTGKWRVQYYLAGKRYSSTSYVTRAEAERFRDILGGQRASGLLTDPSLPRTTFQAYAEQWYALRPVGLNHAQSRAKERWALDSHLLPYFGSRELGNIQRRTVQTWINASTLAPSSVRTVYAILGQILRTAAADGYLPAGSPISRGLITLPPLDTDRLRILSHAELAHLLAVCEHVLPAEWPLLMLLAGTGMREAEALGLERRDVGPSWVDVVTALKRDGGVYRKGSRTKSGRRRRVSLDPPTAEALVVQLAAHSHDLVFPNRDGKPRDANTWRRRQWAQIKAAAGFPDLTPHDLRHTHASHLLDAGVSPAVVMERMGWSNLNIMSRYSHALQDRQVEALVLLAARARRSP